MTNHLAMDDARMIRDRAKQELPKNLFKPSRIRALWIIPLILSAGLLNWAIISGSDSILSALLFALLLGNIYGMFGFFAHELSHGAISVTNKRLNLWIQRVCFAPFLVTPQLWHQWHNVIHHGKTNQGDKDPDSFGTLKRYERSPGQKLLTRLAPGSGTWYSYLFFFYSFLLHSQAVLWLQSKHRKDFKALDRRSAKRDFFILLACWIGFGITIGWQASLFAIIIPMAVGNAVIQCYILTNHFLRPMTEDNNPLDNSMGVRTKRWLDVIHFNFSHHVEHHLFPRMPMSSAPALREWLLKNYPQRYVCPTHWEAIRLLYSTPRVYKDAQTLVNPYQPATEVPLEPINRNINPAYQMRSATVQ